MCGDDPLGGSGDAVLVGAARDELANGAAGGFLHRDSFGVGAFAKRCLFVIGQAQGHCHRPMVSL